MCSQKNGEAFAAWTDGRSINEQLWGERPACLTVIDEVLALYRQDAEWWQEAAVLFAAMLDPRDHDGFLEILSVQSEQI